jgi:mono/diheme cytochrome c family protein
VRRVILVVLGIMVLGFAAIQLVPYGRDHTNPPVGAEPQWDSPATRALVVRACFDCHSNETHWAWYSNVAPASWLIYHDVKEGREKLNFSTWGQQPEEAHESAEQVRNGTMPPAYYLPFHPDAQLTDAERAALIAGLEATFGSEGGDGGGEGSGGGDGD